MYSALPRRWFSMPSPSLSCFFVETRRMETAACGMGSASDCAGAGACVQTMSRLFCACMSRRGRPRPAALEEPVDEGVGEGDEGVANLRHLLVGQLRQLQDLPALLDAQHGREGE